MDTSEIQFLLNQARGGARIQASTAEGKLKTLWQGWGGSNFPGGSSGSKDMLSEDKYIKGGSKLAAQLADLPVGTVVVVKEFRDRGYGLGSWVTTLCAEIFPQGSSKIYSLFI